MKTKVLLLLVSAALLLPNSLTLAAEQSGASAELKTLVEKIQTKLKDGKNTEADLADNLKEFDALMARHKDEKTDDVANILLMQAMLYNQVLENKEKGNALLAQLKRDFPDTKIVASLKQQEEGEKVRAGLAEGTKFPDFDEKDVTGHPLSIANYKGKVVLLDFWATWCGPCVRELPNVIETYKKHHDGGFEIIGISLDKEEAKLNAFTKEKEMTWQQFFDGKVWSNKLAVKYGIQSIPATYLLDGEGKIIGKDLRGEALEEAVTKALAKKS